MVPVAHQLCQFILLGTAWMFKLRIVLQHGPEVGVSVGKQICIKGKFVEKFSFVNTSAYVPVH